MRQDFIIELDRFYLRIARIKSALRGIQDDVADLEISALRLQQHQADEDSQLGFPRTKNLVRTSDDLGDD